MSITHVGKNITDTLIDCGVTWASCVPGESFLPVIDGFRARADDVKLVTFRHEATAAQAAVAHGRRTGNAGVCLVTRGPGALHASIGVHTADQDSAPMILFVGQISTQDTGRGAFQEISCEAVFGSMAKWVARIDSADRASEIVRRAIRIAESGRPGPVVIELPEDVLYHEVTPTVPQSTDINTPALGAISVDAATIITSALAEAQRPLIVIGRTHWGHEQHNLVQQFAESNKIPVAVEFRCQDMFDNTSPSYIGHLAFAIDKNLAKTVQEADLVIAVGGHLGDVETSGYQRRIGAKDARIIHIASSEIDAERVWPVSTVILSPPVDIFRALNSIPVCNYVWQQWVESSRRNYEAFSRPDPSDLIGLMVEHASKTLPKNTVVCNGAGNYALWAHRFHTFELPGTQSAPSNGAMGFGIPAGIAAQISHPETPSLVYAGDGCFLMGVSELATIAANRLKLIIVVVDNERYGTIRTHQDREFPELPYATELTSPEFVDLARSFGLGASRVTTLDEFAQALNTAQNHGGSFLIHIPTKGLQTKPVVTAVENFTEVLQQ